MGYEYIRKEFGCCNLNIFARFIHSYEFRRIHRIVLLFIGSIKILRIEFGVTISSKTMIVYSQFDYFLCNGMCTKANWHELQPGQVETNITIEKEEEEEDSSSAAGEKPHLQIQPFKQYLHNKYSKSLLTHFSRPDRFNLAYVCTQMVS